jgi:ketosteroid isomerase-like protein
MKKSIFTVLLGAALIALNQGPTVEFDDEKSKAVAGIFDAYMANDMQSIADVYAEDAYAFSNSTDSIPMAENLALVSSHHEMFDNIKCVFGDEGKSAWIETTTYKEEGLTITRAWFLWTGVGKASGVAVEVPTQISYMWGDDNRIQRSYLRNDTSAMLKEVEAAQSMMVE